MMFPHYERVVPSYCSGLDWVEQTIEVTQVGVDDGGPANIQGITPV